LINRPPAFFRYPTAEALLTQVSATTRKQDSLQVFAKNGKREGEKLMAQLLRKIIPVGGPTKAKASGLSSVRRYSTIQIISKPKSVLTKETNFSWLWNRARERLRSLRSNSCLRRFQLWVVADITNRKS